MRFYPIGLDMASWLSASLRSVGYETWSRGGTSNTSPGSVVLVSWSPNEIQLFDWTFVSPHLKSLMPSTFQLTMRWSTLLFHFLSTPTTAHRKPHATLGDVRFDRCQVIALNRARALSDSCSTHKRTSRMLNSTDGITNHGNSLLLCHACWNPQTVHMGGRSLVTD